MTVRGLMLPPGFASLSTVALALIVTAPAHAQDAAPNVEHHHSEPATEQSQTTGSEPDEPIGNNPPPPIPRDHPADAYFPTDRMAAARRDLLHDMRARYRLTLLDRLEYRAEDGADGFAWKGEASTGGDRDRFVLYSEGEGVTGGAEGAKVEQAEIHAVWRHALDPWFDAVLGVRHDIRPEPQRTFLVAGIRGLAPYWVEAEAQAFLSEHGEVHFRLEAETDQRITQRLILQPTVELDFSLQDIPELGIASGLTEAALGLRLRYEASFGLAPYVGVEWRHNGPSPASAPTSLQHDRNAASLLFGIRARY